jgi:hypothetical protein
MLWESALQPDCSDAACVQLGSWTLGAKTAPLAPTLAKIQALQGALAGMPQVETGLAHYFATGMYMRECSIPADTVVVGKLHRHDHPVMLIKGSATIATDEGVETIHAPKVWISKAGAKRALVTHEDCVFVTVHATHETDLAALEAELIVPEIIPLPGAAEDDFHQRALQRVFE